MLCLSYPAYQRKPVAANHAELLTAYKAHLADVRGVTETDTLGRTAQCFLAYLDEAGISLVHAGKREIDRFIIEQGSRYQKRTVASIASFLRTFLRYLASEGVLERDLSILVERPRIVQGERNPRYLKSHQVAEVLDTPSRRSVTGLRDRAILMLLAVYGLRSCEVAPIRLDDIRWKTNILCIRHRKCGDTLELPLLPEAAKALAEYLRMRPSSEHREVFLTKYRPHNPIHYSAVTTAAQTAIHRAGVNVNRPGAHTFRYSHAQALFQADLPLPDIAAALGQSDLRTTLGYLQITVHPLREVACNDGEDLA